MKETEFGTVKAAYVQAREDERRKLIDFLALHGFEVTKRGKSGMGVEAYTNYGRLEKPYDLRNWKYIDAFKNGVLYFISLQAFDHDPNSGNWHVLMDRIGVYRYECPSFSERYNKKCYKADDAFRLMKTSSYDLPLCEEDMQGLIDWMQAADK